MGMQKLNFEGLTVMVSDRLKQYLPDNIGMSFHEFYNLIEDELGFKAQSKILTVLSDGKSLEVEYVFEESCSWYFAKGNGGHENRREELEVRYFGNNQNYQMFICVDYYCSTYQGGGGVADCDVKIDFFKTNIGDINTCTNIIIEILKEESWVWSLCDIEKFQKELKSLHNPKNHK